MSRFAPQHEIAREMAAESFRRSKNAEEWAKRALKLADSPPRLTPASR